MSHKPTEEQVAKLTYDPESGFLIWKHNGTRAGGISSGGYRSVTLNLRRYLEHRLIWFIQTGEWPPEEIDHINRKRDDNRWKNLRLATKAQNGFNRSGVTGVSWHCKRQKWQALIKVRGKSIYLGGFVDRNDAKQAYLKAKEKYHVTAN